MAGGKGAGGRLRGRRLFAWIGGGLLAAAGLAAAWDVATYDERAWAADFERLKRDMAQGHANLDWIAQHRRLDLAALSRETAGDLDGAHSRVFAYLALRRFLSRFGDPHLQFEWRGDKGGGPATASAEARPPPDPAVSDCAGAGYEEGDHGFAFPVEKLPGWRPLSAGNFPTGMAGRTGILRLAQFGEDQYLSACAARLRPGIGERALRLRVRAALQEELRSRLAQLRRAGAKRLLVDLSGNGGGTEWVGEAVALFTARGLERRAPQLVGPTCDRRAIWEGKRPPCSVFATADAPARIEGRGAWSGPLLVLMDGGTASASEDFVAWMKDNRAATLIGARTYGAGCGYVDGGTRTSLAVLPLDVRIPNCARFLKDGTNEIEGIAPDLALPMDDPDKAAEELTWLLARQPGGA